MQEGDRREMKESARGGFSLVEVSLAILLIGMGILTLFSLFPAGLKQSENAVMDTHVALFAEEVMNGFRANASSMTNWATWSNVANFRAQVLGANLSVSGQAIYGDGAARTISDFIATSQGVTYSMLVDKVSAPHTNLYSANLKVCMGNSWVPAEAQWFYTEVCYPGWK